MPESNYKEALHLLDDYVEKPKDCLDCFWYRQEDDITMSEDWEKSDDPESWGSCYVCKIQSKDGSELYSFGHKSDYYYEIYTVDNGCGDKYQIIVDTRKEILNGEY